MFRAASAFLILSACVKQLPPAPTPAPVAPPIDTATVPPAGYGRLVVDVVEGPMPVERIRMDARPNAAGRYSFIETPEILCATSPCAQDIPAGNLLLAFPVIGDSSAREIELVHVGPETSVYRRSLSIYENNTGAMRVLGIVMTSLGGAAMITGTALLPIGLAKDNNGLTTAGGISLGGGTALLVFGILMIRADSPSFRPGSSNHFPIK